MFGLQADDNANDKVNNIAEGAAAHGFPAAAGVQFGRCYSWRAAPPVSRP